MAKQEGGFISSQNNISRDLAEYHENLMYFQTP